jgi:hypothetical protein
VKSPQKGELMDEAGWQTLAHFLCRASGVTNAQAMEQVVEAVKDLNLPATRLERLKPPYPRRR